MTQLSRNSPCPCGSGKKYKKCHGMGKPGPPSLVFNLAVHGLPGQNGRYYVVPEFKTGDPRNSSPPQGAPGDYRVIFTLAKPGYALVPEDQPKSADHLTGTSHLKLPGPFTIDATLESGEMIPCSFELNQAGVLAKASLACKAVNSLEAYHKAHMAVVRFLSLLSLRFDVPLRIYQVDTVEQQNSALTFTHRNPFLEISVSGSLQGTYTVELRVYASLYREALITESSAYQFLCYYRIAESLRARRIRLDRDAKKAGRSYAVPAETYPATPKDAVSLYETVFPVKLPRQQIIEDGLGIVEALGKSFEDLILGDLKDIRDNIGHTLLQKMEELILTDDALSQSRVEKWLPAIKLIARTMLIHDFGPQFV